MASTNAARSPLEVTVNALSLLDTKNFAYDPLNPSELILGWRNGESEPPTRDQK
jgi:hypothetical protein